jgi:hypothetical protein
MVNTFRPDLRLNERVVKTTSLVWRRNAPKQFYPAGYMNFQNVLEPDAAQRPQPNSGAGGGLSSPMRLSPQINSGVEGEA